MIGICFYIIDADHNITKTTLSATWARCKQDPKLCIVKTDDIGKHHVSTVFLGLNHRHWGEGPPILFETMVFPECDYCERYSTWKEAVAGHARVVDKLLDGQSLFEDLDDE